MNPPPAPGAVADSIAASDDVDQTAGKKSRLDLLLMAGWTVVTILAVLHLSSDPSRQYTGITAATTAIAALGFFLVHQVGGTTLGQAGAMAIGAYTSGVLAIETGMSVFVAMFVGVLASTLIGALLGVLITRARTPFHFILVTFVFSEVVRLVIQRWVYGADGLPNIPSPAIAGFEFNTSERYFWLAMGTLAATTALVWWLMSSNLARTFHTVRDGERHLALSFGVGISIYKVVAFAVASALAGLAGGLQAHFANFVSPEQFNLHFSVLILTAAVFGGLTKVYGPVVGAFVLAFLNEALVAYPGVSIVIYGLVLVVAMLVMPNGLAGLMTALRRLLPGSTERRKVVS